MLFLTNARSISKWMTLKLRSGKGIFTKNQ